MNWRLAVVEVGKEYELAFGGIGESEHKYGIVVEYNHPLVKLRDNQSGKDVIYNLGASNLWYAKQK
jgi:hypothetical protein